MSDLNLRFCADIHDNAAIEVVNSLIDSSIDNWTTTCYDKYQRWCSNVL